MGITSQLRSILAESGITHYRIREDTGIATPALDRFVSGERIYLRSDTMDKLCDYFDLELRKKSGTTAKKQVAKKARATPGRAKKKR